jgi:uncharacterized protein with HEPN domain
MSRTDDLLLEDIREAVRLTILFTADLSYEQFVGDIKTQSAVVRQLEIIGEASKRVSEATRARYPSIPWTILGRMRDKLIHAYHAVDPKVVWDTVHDDLPMLQL